MTAPRFVKLTLLSGSAGYFNPALIAQINADTSGHAIIFTVADVGEDANGVPVRESPAEILALLAAPAPSVEVTTDVLEAACAAEIKLRRDPSPYTDRMRAAIEAADRARGLRT